MTARLHLLPALLLALLGHGAAQAQTTIDQAKAMNGTLPGDSAGFPVTISQPGHYQLTSNLVVPLDIRGIEISAPGVTLDLNGFTVSSSISCSQNSTSLQVNCGAGTAVFDGNLLGKTGIYIDWTSAGAVVRNGAVRGFRGHGVRVGASNVRLEGLRVFSNRYHGIDTAGVLAHVHISDTQAFENGSDGMHTSGAYLARVSASNNGGSGIDNTYGIVVDSLVTHNGTYGVRGSEGYGVVGVRGSLLYSNKLLNMGPTAVSMGGNKTHAGSF